MTEIIYLHDVMPLCVLVEVGLGELQRVVEGAGGGEAHLVTRLVPPHPVHDRGQDLVCGLLQKPDR